jgi:hypothetical protein
MPVLYFASLFQVGNKPKRRGWIRRKAIHCTALEIDYALK